MRSRAILASAGVVLAVSFLGAQQPSRSAPTAGGSAPSPATTTKPAGQSSMGAMKSAPMSDAALIKSAMAAAPLAVSQNATIIAPDDKGQIRTLRKGTNGWTCMPDMPESPGQDPMCVDPNGLDWAMAWMQHKPPTTGKMGFGYMLMGGSDASNEDPFATKPAAGQAWVDTGPHVMVFNPGLAFAGYPKDHKNPKAPYVMWANTPYEHLMIPVR
jgi:hypothetical protein